MSTATKSLTITSLLAIVVALLITLSLAGLYFSSVYRVMTKSSPDGSHVAKLYRYQGIDVNFNLIVDGTSVFYSPDFAPIDADFREHIAWDASGQNVVLMVGGERIFGYRPGDGRSLTESELLSVRFTPFDDLRFEGKLPSSVSEN